MQEAAVVGLPDARWGQAVTAFLVASDQDLTSEAVDAFCRASEDIAPHKRPRRYVFPDQLPANPGGKVPRRELIARHAPQESA
jgi:fatty-acyl-CoA synthase